MTIPLNAPNRELALAYVELLLSPDGQAVMERNGQSPIVPALTGEINNLPESLKRYCQSP